MHSDYAERLHDADLRRFDWTKAQQLRGSALKLWMVFTSTRVPYRSVLDSRDGLELVEIPLTLDHCNALGVYNSNDAGRRRTLNEARSRPLVPVLRSTRRPRPGQLPARQYANHRSPPRSHGRTTARRKNCGCWWRSSRSRRWMIGFAVCSGSSGGSGERDRDSCAN